MGFFEPVRDFILERLSREPILEAYSGRMIPPAMLTYTPRGQFSDDTGLPLTLSPNTMDSYLSSRYPEWAAASLSVLGTRILDAEGFLEHLSWMISNDPRDFRQRHWRWHSQLAKVLLSLVNEKGLLESMKGLDIIPLSNGEWVSADVGPIYFSQGPERLTIPQTVPIRTINPVVERNLSRRNLLVHLGAKPRPDAADVCRLIIEMHRDSSFKLNSLTHAQLVEHIGFMFGASFDLPPGVDLWFATSNNQRAKGSSLYIRANVKAGSYEDRVREHVETNYPLIHGAYAGALAGDGPAGVAWRTWIRRCFGIQLSTLPRISVGAPNGRGSGTLRLSDEFRSLFKGCDSSDVLDLLRVRWREYSRVVEETYLVEGKDWRNPVRDEIAAMEVKCYTGMGSKDPCFRRLRDIFLPSLDKTMDERSCLPLLAISNPSNQGWTALGIFGVSVHRNLEYYFRCLHTLRDSATNLLKTTVAHIYERIQADYMDNKTDIW